MLLKQIMKEKNPVNYDVLCTELWRVLNALEGFSGVESTPNEKCISDGPRALAGIGNAQDGGLLSMTRDNVEHQYRVTAWWTSGRTGLAKSDTAPNAIHFTAPAQFGGIEGRWTPEELLLAAVAGCFTTTLRAIATGTQIDFTDLEVEASATLRKMEIGYGLCEIVLRPTLRIGDAAESRHALDLLRRAERLCLVSRALAMPLRFEPQLEVTPALSSLQ
jgi:organic hydroperoxide reductase OsmC/OhrA